MTALRDALGASEALPPVPPLPAIPAPPARVYSPPPERSAFVAEGLSAVACAGAGKLLRDAVARACTARGLVVGTPVAARFARVWLEDEIGQETGAKVAMILLGERPGLGTGDGLSAYVVYDPKLGNTDGDRNMISNIHARGTPIDEAARRLAAFASAMIEQRT